MGRFRSVWLLIGAAATSIPAITRSRRSTDKADGRPLSSESAGLNQIRSMFATPQTIQLRRQGSSCSATVALCDLEAMFLLGGELKASLRRHYRLTAHRLGSGDLPACIARREIRERHVAVWPHRRDQSSRQPQTGAS